jgi:hypothetical protein
MLQKTSLMSLINPKPLMSFQLSRLFSPFFGDIADADMGSFMW